MIQAAIPSEGECHIVLLYMLSMIVGMVIAYHSGRYFMMGKTKHEPNIQSLARLSKVPEVRLPTHDQKFIYLVQVALSKVIRPRDKGRLQKHQIEEQDNSDSHEKSVKLHESFNTTSCIYE
jgi:hypothetical protein